jgi:multiple sugar transport system substrate-binding protein
LRHEVITMDLPNEGRPAKSLSAPMSRRRLLAGLGAVGLGAGLAACSVSTSDDSGAQSTTPAGGGGGGSGETTASASGPSGSAGPSGSSSLPAVPDKIVFPAPAQPLPTGNASFGVMITSGIKKPFFDAVFAAYHEAHPNIKMNYSATNWPQINQTIPLGVQNGTCPDMFQKPQTVPVQVAVSEGWLAALDDIIPNFDQWKAQYPSTAFIPGVHVFNGKTYSWTFTSTRSQYGDLMWYDSGYMQDAGYDPANDRMTWDTLRDACKKITQAGQGKYYGLIMGNDQLGSLPAALAELAGGRGVGSTSSSFPGMDWLTGEFVFTAPELQAAFELLKAIQTDKSIFPGFLNQATGTALTRMPQRIAGILFDGAWSIPTWEQAGATSYKYGVAKPPTGNDKTIHNASFTEGTAAPLFIYAKTKYPHVAGDLLSYMGSLQGQTMLGILTKGIFTSELDEANTMANRSSLITGQSKQAGEFMADLMRIEPMPQVRNADVSQVILQMKAIQPNLNDIGQGYFSGQIKDIKGALKKLNDDSEKNLTDAIAAAQKKGAKVSRDDWKFANWDPTKDYTADDYKALGS